MSRLMEWPVRAWCRLTGAFPVWLKDDTGRIHIKVARLKFDPFCDEKDLVIWIGGSNNRGYRRLASDGTLVMPYGSRWRWKHARKNLHVEMVLKQ